MILATELLGWRPVQLNSQRHHDAGCFLDMVTLSRPVDAMLGISVCSFLSLLAWTLGGLMLKYRDATSSNGKSISFLVPSKQNRAKGSWELELR